MSAGDAAGYRGEALIGITEILKPVCRDKDLVNLALPLRTSLVPALNLGLV